MGLRGLSMSPRKPSVAITGVGCVTAFGQGVQQLWTEIKRGHTAVLTRNSDKPYLPPLVLTAQAPPMEVESQSFGSGLYRPSRTSVLARLAASEAWSMSGISGQFDPDRTALLINRNFGQHDLTGGYYERLWDKGPGGVSGLQFVQTIANAVLGHLALVMGLRGPSLLSLGPSSLGLAVDTLRDGKADVVLAGSVDELSGYVLTLCHLGEVAAHYDQELNQPRPYDSRRSGLVPGEAAVFFVLETLAHAQARGASPLAFLRGYACVTDERSLSNPLHRSEREIEAAISRALADSGTDQEELAAISGAGAGLHDFDEMELEGICRALFAPPPVLSVKGAIGETWGAAGGLSVLTGVLALREGVLPPTVNSEAPESRGAVRVASKELAIKGTAVLALSLDMCCQNCAYVCAAEP